jgi:hypothetical protein
VGALVLLFPAVMVSFDPGEVWARIAWADGTSPPPAEGSPSGEATR